MRLRAKGRPVSHDYCRCVACDQHLDIEGRERTLKHRYNNLQFWVGRFNPFVLFQAKAKAPLVSMLLRCVFLLTASLAVVSVVMAVAPVSMGNTTTTSSHGFNGTAMQSLGVGDTTCGGNCPAGCESCPCGSSANYIDPVAWCKLGDWDQLTCQCIIKASMNNANFVSTNYAQGGEQNVGMFAIPQSLRGSKTPPCGPQQNVQIASSLYAKYGSMNIFPAGSQCH